MRQTNNRGRIAGLWLVFILLAIATMAAYYPAWHGRLLWDDDAHITASSLRSVDGLRRIWFEVGATQQFYPVVHSVFWVLHRAWDDDPLGYHLFNILLHAVTAFLVGFALRRLAVPGAWLAAMLFALHPIQVESVAWISEMKNTLSGALYLSAGIAYLRFDERREKPWYGLAFVLFGLAVLSKSVTATLPAALLVVFWWKRGKLDPRRDLLPLAPFIALGTAAGAFTIWVERALIGAQGAEFQFSIVERFLIAGRAAWFYVGKILWPANLTFIYPRWHLDQSAWWQPAFPIAAIAVIAAAWLARKRSRGPLATVLLFCGTLFPALGFVNVYPFRYSFVADHFQYLACMFLFTAIAALLARITLKSNMDFWAKAAAILVAGTLLATLTWRQSGQYADEETLYRATVRRNPSCWLAENNLGFLKIASDTEQAISHFRRALDLKADYAVAHSNLCNALRRSGRLDEAEKECLDALRIEPRLAEAHNNLANTLELKGRIPEAISHFQEAVRLRPDLGTIRFNLGNTLLRMDHAGEAVEQYTVALKLDPESPVFHYHLGVAYEALSRLPEAAHEYKAALRLKPDYAPARAGLARVQK